jgi:hydrogenase-4 component E
VNGGAQVLLVAILLLDVSLAASARMAVLIRAFALQAALVAVLALVLDGFANPHAWAVASGTFLLKAVLIPYFLGRAGERTHAGKERTPAISYGASLLLAAAGMALSFALAARLPETVQRSGALLGAAAFATMFIGLLLLVSRGTALAQVIGYLVLENGIFLFGLGLLNHMPLLVEMGILLDVFVGTFVMGIVVYNIHRTFDHIDVRVLTALREGEEREDVSEEGT